MSQSFSRFRVLDDSTFTRRWNEMLSELDRLRLTVTPPLLLGETGAGTNLSIIRQTPGSSASQPPFQVINGTEPLTVAVRGGAIMRHDQDFDLFDPDQITSGDIAIPANSTAYVVWIQIDNEFSLTPTFTATAGASVPTTPNPPARKYRVLALVDSDADKITKIVQKWRGDIPWPSIYGFYSPED